jgi:two-component system, sensor histidine kinase YesM
MPSNEKMNVVAEVKAWLGKFRISNSIFSRLVATFLLIMIPIYALGIYIYNWGLHTVENEIAKSTVSQLSFYLAGLENEIERVKMLQYDCLNDDALNNLAIRWETMTPYQRVDNMNLLRQRLQTIKNSSIYIKNVRAHIRPIQRTISANSGIDDFSVNHFEFIRSGENVKGAQIVFYEGGYYLSTLQNGRLTGKHPLFMIEIELSPEVFGQALAQFNIYEGSGSVLVDLTTGAIVAQRYEGPLPALAAASSPGMEFLSRQGSDYYLAQARSDYLNWALQRYIPAKIVHLPLQHFYVWIWVFTLTAFGLILVYSFYTYRVMHKPLLLLVKSFRKVEEGDLNVSIPKDSKNEFGYMYERFNDMVHNLRALIDQVYNQKLLAQRAELKQLQSQINPHFLYNSFFILNTMARVGDENLIPFTKLLGEYFRFITRSGEDNVPLRDEVAHARAYTDIQRMRFPKRLSVDFAQCPEAWSDFNVPRLILQPLIENAFEHGVGKKSCDGKITVGFHAEGGSLRIIVEDNGSISDEGIAALDNAIEEGANREITGLMNIHRRVRLLFGPPSGLKAQRSGLGGLKITLLIAGREERCTGC